MIALLWFTVAGNRSDIFEKNGAGLLLHRETGT